MLLQLTENQLKKLADIASDIALIALASVALPSILDHIDASQAFLGVIISFSFWSVSLWLLKSNA